MKKRLIILIKNTVFLFFIAASLFFCINTNAVAAMYTSTAVSQNDADVAYWPFLIDSLAYNSSAGWAIGPAGLDGEKQFEYREALIELDISHIHSNEMVDSAFLNLYVMEPIQNYNHDGTLAQLDHLSSTGYTGNAASDYLHIDGPVPVVDCVHVFPDNTQIGWQAFDVTDLISVNLENDVDWAVFWLRWLPPEDGIDLLWEAKGINIASADRSGGVYAPRLDVQTAPVPIPGSISLLCSGLLGLIGLQRRTNKRMRSIVKTRGEEQDE